jgi:hypothetical protein
MPGLPAMLPQIWLLLDRSHGSTKFAIGVSRDLSKAGLRLIASRDDPGDLGDSGLSEAGIICRACLAVA